MNKKKIYTLIGVGTGILTLSTLMFFGNVSSAFSEGIAGKSSKYSEQEYVIQDSTIKTFELDTNRVKPLFSRDVFDNDIGTISPDISAKLAACLVELTNEKIFAIGDFKPMYFLEGEDKVSIAIKHADGTTSLTEFDISKEKPVKIGHKVEEVRQ